MIEKRGRKSLGDLALVAMDPHSGRPATARGHAGKRVAFKISMYHR